MVNFYYNRIFIRSRNNSIIRISLKAELIGGIICFIKTDCCGIIALGFRMTHRVVTEFITRRCSIRIVKLSKHLIKGYIIDPNITILYSVLYSVKNNGIHIIAVCRIKMTVTTVIVIPIKCALVSIVMELINTEITLFETDRG